MPNVALRSPLGADAWQDAPLDRYRQSVFTGPVASIAAMEHLAALSVQPGGSWSGSVLGLASTYGPIGLYLAILVVCGVALSRFHRAAVDKPEADPLYAVAGSRAGSPRALLFAYEAAYLAGGPARVVETALAALLDEGWIESTLSGRLHLGHRGDLVTAPDPVGIPVLSVVAAGPPTAAREIRRRAARLREVLDVSRILYARRLLVTHQSQRRLRLLTWGATGLLALAGVALVLVTAIRSQEPASAPVFAAAAALLVAVAVTARVARSPLFRSADGEVELHALRASVCDKARWVAGRVWSDESGSADEDGPWADVDRIADALQRPAASRPVQLAWLWGREDAQMAVAVRGPRAIPDPGLRRGLDGRGGPRGRPAKPGSSTGLSTPVHKMVGTDDA